MWFELIDTAIAAAGFGLASVPLFKKNVRVTKLVISEVYGVDK